MRHEGEGGSLLLDVDAPDAPVRTTSVDPPPTSVTTI